MAVRERREEPTASTFLALAWVVTEAARPNTSLSADTPVLPAPRTSRKS